MLGQLGCWACAPAPDSVRRAGFPRGRLRDQSPALKLGVLGEGQPRPLHHQLTSNLLPLRLPLQHFRCSLGRHWIYGTDCVMQWCLLLLKSTQDLLTSGLALEMQFFVVGIKWRSDGSSRRLCAHPANESCLVSLFIPAPLQSCASAGSTPPRSGRSSPSMHTPATTRL